MAKDEWNWWEEDETGAARGDRPATKDANGTPLADGDSVILVKDLKVKGAGQTLKRGTVVKNIRLTDNVEEVDCRTDAIKGLVLRTEYVKKR
jgi:protein PhnA